MYQNTNVVSMPHRQTISRCILQQLSNWGVRRIYGYAGDSILTFLSEMSNQHDIKFISAKTEHAAALMASAEAKLTGNLAVCIAHAGPGIGNMYNGLADAYSDQVPLLVITGQVESEYIGTDHKQYIDQQVMLQPITGYSSLVASPLGLVNTLSKAIKTAINQKTVAHISIPKDFFHLTAPEPPRNHEPYLFTQTTSSQEVISGAVERLNQSQRPVIVIGRGAWGQTEMIQQLAEKWGAAVVNTLAGTGVVPYGYPLAVGGIGLAGTDAAKEVLHKADMVLRLGATWWPEKYVPRELRVIQVDENSTSIGSPVPVEYGVVGKVATLLPHFINGIQPAIRHQWRETISDAKNRWQQVVENETSIMSEKPVTPSMVMGAVNQCIKQDALIALDTGNHSVWFARDFQAAYQNVLFSGKWRTMGFALPAANSAAINHPGRQVVAIVGDGCLNMQLAELTTTAEMNLPVTVIVIKNDTLGMEKQRMQIGNMAQLGVDLYNPDFAGVAKACGINSWKVTNSSMLVDSIRDALNSGRPGLVEVPVQEPIPPGLSL